MRYVTNALIGAIVGLAGTAAAHAEFPEKPIRLVIPFGAGGGSDGLARAVQAAIEKNDLLPVPLVVVNAEGAAGTVGSRQVLDAEPDGYTILQIHQEMFAVSAVGRVEYTPDDFEPIIQATQGCMYLAVPANSEFTSLEELIAHAKENPGALKQADDIGGVTHFPSAQLMRQADAEWTIVPTGATSARFAALKGGFADMALMSAPWLDRGKEDLRALAALTEKRFDTAPDLQTAKELGYDVTSCLVRRYWAPADTPQENIDILADAIEAAVQTDEVQQYIAESNEETLLLRGEELREAIEADYQSFVDVADVVRGSAPQQ